MDIDHESLYVTELTYLRKGRPLWEPNPDTLYDCVRIGDVGYFQNGKFVPIFNILPPDDSNPNRHLPFVPQPDFPPLRLIGTPTHRTNPLAGVYALERGLTFSISGGIESTGSVLHGETSLTFNDEKGAALILPYQARREDVVNPWPFKKHMLDNYRNWTEFVETTCQLEKGTRLVLVTGCDLTRQWATATYFRNNREIALGGGGGVASVASANFSLSTGWARNQAINTRQGPPQDGEVGEPSDNQCVFLRGFYIKDRFLLGPKVLKAGAGYHDLGGRDPEDDVERGLLASEDIIVESFLPPTQDESLITVLLDYMLEESNADIVVAHDSDLWPYLQGTPNRENLRETLKNMSPHVHVEGGVGSLVVEGIEVGGSHQGDQISGGESLGAGSHTIRRQDHGISPDASPLTLQYSQRPNDDLGEGLKSTFRDRSRSPARGSRDQKVELLPVQGSTSPKLDMLSSWYGDNHVRRPWQGSPKKKKTVPYEQTLALDETRKKVAQAVSASLGTIADVAHEALYIGVEFLDLAPIPRLAPAAKTLLNIWDAVEAVDMSRLSCLRLTERCADILLSVRKEIYEAGDVVGQELAAPIAKLEESFMHVSRFMIKQTNRPWLKRYLKRDEILRNIADCDSALRDALGLFGLSVQIRILKKVQQTEKRREHETQSLRAILDDVHLAPKSELKPILSNESQVSSPEPSPYVLSTELSSEETTEFITKNNILGLIEGSSATPLPGYLAPSQILPVLETIHTAQNSLDAARDTSDLRQLMRNALQTSSDAEMVEVLQIGRQEIPEAIKTLQRELERLAERDGGVTEPPPGPGIITGKVVRQVTMNEAEGSGRTIKHAETMDTVINVDSSSSSDAKKKDTLDLEFIETGIDSLRRMSGGDHEETIVPSWTITKYEVDRDEKIGIGFFSEVYRGTWRGRAVAIKVLAESTPRALFVHEMGIWKTLHHPNVLPLYGASSTTGDPPWFFVSPYMKNGTLVDYLKRVEHEDRPSGLGVGVDSLPSMPLRSPGGRSITLASPWSGVSKLSPNAPSENTLPGSQKKAPPRDSSNEVPREWDLFRFMHEIAKGMECLHEQGVLHGDLKASNVLVSDDRYRCVIADFGLSELKSEAYRISGTPLHGTLRWQSPEIMTGLLQQLTPEADVWAFSICCVEILTMGRIPWPLMDDTSVRHSVLKENSRPALPKHSRFNTPGIQEILRACWQTEPAKRPSFKKVARDLKLLRKSSGQDILDSPYIPPIEDLPEPVSPPSPDMRPVDVPQGASAVSPTDILAGSLNSHHTAHKTPVTEDARSPHQENTVATATTRMPEPVIYSSSVFVPSSRSSGEHGVYKISDDGYDSPPPVDERIAEIKNERRYRLLLTHAFHRSLTLPLWDPSPVELGAVGYLSKPEGRFITLFNANNPRSCDDPGIKSLPPILGYGQVTEGVQRLPKKTVTQSAFDMIIASLTFRNARENIAKRLRFDLKAGHKAAYLYADTTEYSYMETLDAPKKWFQSNVDTIMDIYSYRHHIQKEDLFLVTGTLRTPNYALLVSHSHPEGSAVFNVYSNPKVGKPWGMFTTDNAASRTSGPSYDLEESEEVPRISASKVSCHGGSWDAVLLARLRFKPDVLEPTSK